MANLTKTEELENETTNVESIPFLRADQSEGVVHECVCTDYGFFPSKTGKQIPVIEVTYEGGQGYISLWSLKTGKAITASEFLGKKFTVTSASEKWNVVFKEIVK